MANVKHVVVDSGAFIRNAPIKDIGQNVYTIADVVGEIKDKTTRQSLQVLPYELKFREPPTEAIKHVTEFSKKTGDYKSLSAVDIRLMALVYQLEKENVGTKHLREKPERKTTWTSTKHQLEKPTQIAGFYIKKKNDNSSRATSRTVSETESVSQELAKEVNQVSLTDTDEILSTDPIPETNTVLHAPLESKDVSSHTETAEVGETVADKEAISSSSNAPNDGTVPTESPNIADSAESKVKIDSEETNVVTDRSHLCDGDTLPTSSLEEVDDSDDAYESEEEDDDDDDDDDDEGWITPSNIKAVKSSLGEDTDAMRDQVEVACITTDFAMQNVLIQMGLNVVSVDGYIIKHAKSYVLRCFACMKITTNVIKEFCPNCGNKTLQKVSMTVNDDGSIHYYISRRKPPSTRGLKYPLPKPQGGKHANNPVLCEDQGAAYQRLSKAAKVKYNPFDPDYVANTSPFAPVDIYSRSAQLGIKNKRNNFRSRRNPNENSRLSRRK